MVPLKRNLPKPEKHHLDAFTRQVIKHPGIRRWDSREISVPGRGKILKAMENEFDVSGLSPAYHGKKSTRKRIGGK